MNTVLRRSDQDRTSLRLRIPAEPSPLQSTNRITSNTINIKQYSVAQPAPPNLPPATPQGAALQRAPPHPNSLLPTFPSHSPGSSASARPSSSQLAPPNLPQPLPREQRFSAPLPPPKSAPFPSQKTSRAVCVVRRLLERRRSLERVLCALMYRYAVLQAQARLRTTHTARRTFWGKPYDLIYSVFL